MQGGPVDQLLDVSVERAALDELQVGVGRNPEDLSSCAVDRACGSRPETTAKLIAVGLAADGAERPGR
jgi:hypothetical protein